MAKLSNDELIEAFKEMSLIELSDFVKLFEETFDVTAAAPAAVAVAAADDAGNPTGKQRRGGLSFQEGGKQLPGIRFPEIPVDVCGG